MSLLDYPIAGPPTLSLAAFTHVLQQAHSPIAGEAAGVYNAFVSQGINPVVGLAISQHESGYGTAGIAVGRNNPYGDRYYPSAAPFGGVNKGGWVHFPSYTSAARYEAHLLRTGYSGYTARTFAEKYAPARDHNNPNAYGAAIVSYLTTHGGGKAVPYSFTKPTPTRHTSTIVPSKAVAKGSLTAYARAHPRTTVGGGIAALLLLFL